MKTCIYLAMGMLLFVGESVALTISVDYSHDNFFQGNPTAKATMEAAADYIGDVVTSQLAAVNNTVVGEAGQTSVALDWFFVYNNPTTLFQSTLDDISLNADEVKVFVGGANEQSGALAISGPALPGFDANVSGPGFDFVEALQHSEQVVNSTLGRGAGPTILSYQGAPFHEGVQGTYDFQTGPNHGWLSIDVDFNNDGVRDTPQQLEEDWHFDYQTPVPEGKYDLYSIALHEMLHVLGLGPGETYFELSRTGQWTGDEVQELLDGDMFTLDPTGHIEGFERNTRLSDGLEQEPLMSARIDRGVRHDVTLLDLAVLRDLNYETIIDIGSLGDFHLDGQLSIEDLDALVTELAQESPSKQFDVNGDGAVDTNDVSTMLSRLAQQNGRNEPYFPGDINLDGIVDAQDLNRLGRNWTQMTTGWSQGDLFPDGEINALDLNILGNNWLKGNQPLAAVPEPNSSLILWIALMVIVRKR